MKNQHKPMTAKIWRLLDKLSSVLLRWFSRKKIGSSLISTGRMFTETPNLNELRQGDIIQGLYYPLMKCKTIRLLGEPTDSGAETSDTLSLSATAERKSGFYWFPAQIPVFRGHSVVLSQCCDLERRNGNQDAIAFVIAPLKEIPRLIRSDPDRLDRLKENSLRHYVNLFYIPHHPPLSQDYIIDFNMVVSIPQGEYDFALSKKILQMTDEARVCLKLKIANHFGRPADEGEKELASRLFPSS